MKKGQFKKGQSGNPLGKPKGTVSDKTKFWNEMKDFMINEGASKFQQELMKLNGSQYVNAYANSMEYFQPKLARTALEVSGEMKHEVVTTEKALEQIVEKLNKNATS